MRSGRIRGDVATRWRSFGEHCDAVGRDIAEDLTFTLGVKFTIRDSEAEAVRVYKAAMEHNKTPLADVEDDDHVLERDP